MGVSDGEQDISILLARVKSPDPNYSQTIINKELARLREAADKLPRKDMIGDYHRDGVEIGDSSDGDYLARADVLKLL